MKNEDQRPHLFSNKSVSKSSTHHSADAYTEFSAVEDFDTLFSGIDL